MTARRWIKRVAFDALWLAVGALAIGAGLDYAIGRVQREQAQQVPFVATVTARRGDFIIYTDQVGKLEVEEGVVIKAETQGQVIGLVPSGTVVREGEVIISLDAPRMQLALEDAQRNLQKAKDRIASTQHDRDADVRRAELGLQEAKAEDEQARLTAEAQRADKEAQLGFDQQALTEEAKRLEQTRRRAQEGLIPAERVRSDELRLAGQRFALEKEKEDIDLDAARAKSEAISRESKLRMAQSGLERAKSRRDDDLKNARDELQTQTRQVQRANEELAKAIIRAPKAGMVAMAEQYRGMGEMRTLEEGDQVGTNQTVAQILDLGRIQALLQLPQRVGPMAKRGQRAIVWVHGLPGQQFPGEVIQVSPFAGQGDDSFSGPLSQERSFRTCVRVRGFKPGLLKPGMRATVRVVIDEVKNAVSVPVVCVFARGVGKRQSHVVWLRQGGSFRETPVKLGQANQESVIVESGLSADAVIALRDLEGDAGSPRGPRIAALASVRTGRASLEIEHSGKRAPQ